MQLNKHKHSIYYFFTQHGAIMNTISRTISLVIAASVALIAGNESLASQQATTVRPDSAHKDVSSTFKQVAHPTAPPAGAATAATMYATQHIPFGMPVQQHAQGAAPVPAGTLLMNPMMGVAPQMPLPYAPMGLMPAMPLAPITIHALHMAAMQQHIAAQHQAMLIAQQQYILQQQQAQFLYAYHQQKFLQATQAQAQPPPLPPLPVEQQKVPAEPHKAATHPAKDNEQPTPPAAAFAPHRIQKIQEKNEAVGAGGGGGRGNDAATDMQKKGTPSPHAHASTLQSTSSCSLKRKRATEAHPCDANIGDGGGGGGITHDNADDNEADKNEDSNGGGGAQKAHDDPDEASRPTKRQKSSTGAALAKATGQTASTAPLNMAQFIDDYCSVKDDKTVTERNQKYKKNALLQLIITAEKLTQLEEMHTKLITIFQNPKTSSRYKQSLRYCIAEVKKRFAQREINNNEEKELNLGQYLPTEIESLNPRLLIGLHIPRLSSSTVRTAPQNDSTVAQQFNLAHSQASTGASSNAQTQSSTESSAVR